MKKQQNEFFEMTEEQDQELKKAMLRNIVLENALLELKIKNDLTCKP